MKHIIYCLLIAYVLPGILQAQSDDQNYRITRSYTTIDANRSIDLIEYVDGVGRPTQTVHRKVTPGSQDLVFLHEYDKYGRDSLIWLPAMASVNGEYMNADTVKYRAINLYGNDKKPYSKPIYEPSPLNRVVQQYGPGEDWYKNEKSVHTSFHTNLSQHATFNCINYRLVETNTGNTTIQIQKIGNYDTGQLYVTQTQDENGNISYEFTNKNGQLVLTRQKEGTSFLDTYYIYDKFENLRVVLPPLAVDGMELQLIELPDGWNETSTIIQQYAYLYKYDHRNRCIAKKLPGAGWIEYVYDKAGRLIFTRDAVQQANGEWLFILPDELGRTVLTGICKNTNIDYISYKDLIVKAEYTGDTQNFGYQFTNFIPVSSSILSVNYYDRYDFLQDISAFSDCSYDPSQEENGYGRMHDLKKGYETKGLLTGTITSLFGHETSLWSAIYYDYRKQAIQTQSINHTGGKETGYTEYNFIGQPLRQLHIHQHENNQPTIRELYAYHYDFAGYLFKTTHQVNDNPVITLLSTERDDLGRVKKEAIGTFSY